VGKARGGLLILALTLVACDETRIRRSPADPRSRIEFCIAEDSASAGTEPVRLTDPPGTVHVRPEVVISNSDIKAVAVEPSRIGYRISILFTDQAAARLRAVTERNLQKRMAIMIDGSILIAPVIQEHIGEQVAIEHAYSKGEAIALARRIAP